MNEFQGEIPTLDQLFGDLSHPNPNINKKAYLNLVKYWPDQSLPRLLANLNSNDIHLRRISVKALGAFGHKILNPLAEIFNSSDNRMLRVSCLKVFVQVSANYPSKDFPVEIIRLIEMAMKDSSPEIILTVIPLLRQLGKQGLPLLIKAAKDSNILKVSAALTALGELDDPSARNFLLEFVDSEIVDPMLKASAMEAIDTCNQRNKI